MEERLYFSQRKCVKKIDYRKNPYDPKAKGLVFVTSNHDVQVSLPEEESLDYFVHKTALFRWSFINCLNIKGISSHLEKDTSYVVEDITNEVHEEQNAPKEVVKQIIKLVPSRNSKRIEFLAAVRMSRRLMYSEVASILEKVGNKVAINSLKNVDSSSGRRVFCLGYIS